ncbi:NAD(P)H-dependent oxidoreductase subunit E [bacterium]|nr:NAD(P)H-dependent oxidoreductase subunit E [bacterium]
MSETVSIPKLTKDDTKKLDGIFKRYPKNEASLIMVLQDIQDEIHWLHPDALDRTSEELDVPRGRVESVATFYRAFALEPRGKKLVKVCMGTACHVRGAGMLVDEIERQLGVTAGHGMSEDGLFSLETVNCVGACAMAPVVVVDDNYYAEVGTGKLEKIFKQERKS